MQIAQGQMKKFNLCAQCAEEQGVTDSASFSLAEMILQGGGQPEAPAETPDLRCPSCGFSLDDLRKTQRLGCSHCYDAFREELLPVLQNLHDAVRHTGRLPQGIAATRRLQDELSGLKQELGNAVAAESYEQAAELRDRIQQVEQSLEQLRN